MILKTSPDLLEVDNKHKTPVRYNWNWIQLEQFNFSGINGTYVTIFKCTIEIRNKNST